MEGTTEGLEKRFWWAKWGLLFGNDAVLYPMLRNTVFRAGFRPDSNRESFKSALRPAFGRQEG